MADRDAPPSALRRDAPDSRSLRSDGPAGGADPEPSFEAALERLEEIVGRLEEGELALEDALQGFEEGVRLSRRLADRLADAERRIERLVREGAGLAARPLRPGDESGEDEE